MNDRNHLIGPATLLAALMAVTAGCASDGSGSEDGAAALYDEHPPGATQRCIGVRNVRSIDPVGDHTLLFRMNNGEVWRNRLDRRCPGMRSDTVFSYELRSSDQLCSIDTVYQLDRMGDHFRRGLGCALGEFDHLTEDQAEAVKEFR